MLTQQRHEIILKLLKEKGSITVTEVRDLLDTSESTVRRDITALDLFIPAAGISGYLNGLLISQIFLFLCCILRLSVYAGKY